MGYAVLLVDGRKSTRVRFAAMQTVAEVTSTAMTAKGRINCMRLDMRSGLFAAAALALAWSGPAGAVDIPIPGKIGIVKDTKLFKLVAKPVSAFTIPGVGS